MEIKVSILDYLGKIDNSILVLISFVYKGKYHEGIFVYTDEKILLTIDDSLEEAIGCRIEDYKEYTDILRFILKNVVPWSEMITRIDDVDFSIFEPKTSETVYLAGEVDSSEVKIAGTQS